MKPWLLFIFLLAFLPAVYGITPAEQALLDQQQQQDFMDSLAERDAYILGVIDERTAQVEQDLNNILKVRVLVLIAAGFCFNLISIIGAEVIIGLLNLRRREKKRLIRQGAFIDGKRV